MQYQRQSGYVILFISIIVSAIGVIIALNTLLQAQQRTEVSIASDNNLKSNLLVEQCSQQVINNLRQNRYYQGGQTLSLDTETSCHVFPITGNGNGERTFITQFSLQQDPYNYLNVLDNPPETQTLYQKTTLSSLSPEMNINSQRLIDTIHEPYITRLTDNDPNRIETPLLWLRADTLTISNYQSLSEWSGQESTLNQTDDSLQPQYQTRQFRGRPSVVFESDDKFPLPSDSDIETAIQDTSSSIVVVGMVNLTNPNSSGYAPIVLSNSATDTSTWETNDTIWNDLGDINQIFPENNGSLSFDVEGEILELIVYDTDLTTDDRDSLETYFKTKYNL